MPLGCSSHLRGSDELLTFSDRLLVMHSGKIVGEFDPVNLSVMRSGRQWLERCKPDGRLVLVRREQAIRGGQPLAFLIGLSQLCQLVLLLVLLGMIQWRCTSGCSILNRQSEVVVHNFKPCGTSRPSRISGCCSGKYGPLEYWRRRDKSSLEL